MAAPGAPTDLAASVVSATVDVPYVHLTWLAPTTGTVDHYLVLGATAELGPYTSLGTTIARYFDVTPAPEVDTYYLVEAVNGDGTSSDDSNVAFGEGFAPGTGLFWSDLSHGIINTANPDAVSYLLDNAVRYLKAHPEIDVFDFWPPDGGRWATCKELEALGTPQDRQVKLVSQLHARLGEVRPGLGMEMIAYADALLPPETVSVPADVLVEFCPIDQSFDGQIDDPSIENNARYVAALRAWRR